MTTSIIQQNPSETDLQQANRFSFVVSKLPDTTYFCQQITTPGITLPAIAQANIFSNISHPSSKLEFDPTISLTFKVNENIANYMELYNWIAAMGQPRRFGALKELQNQNNLGNGEYADLVVTVRTPKGNPSTYIKCLRCFPMSLTGLTFTTDNSDVQYLQATVQFSYTTFTIESV